ncbi:MAG: hypothetical protein ACKOXB_10005 [Flavobacteriales bacterium]
MKRQGYKKQSTKIAVFTVVFVLLSFMSYAGTTLKSRQLSGKTGTTPKITGNAVLDFQDDFYFKTKTPGSNWQSEFSIAKIDNYVYLEFLNEIQRQ